MNTSRILITSAAGKTGMAAALELLQRRFPVRALVRREDHRAQRLRDAGAEVVVVASVEEVSVDGRSVDDVEVSRMAYRYHDHRALADLVRNDTACEVVLDWLASVPCDIVHVHHVTGFGTSVLEGIKRLGKPLVMTLHDYWALCPRGQMLDTEGAVTERPEPEACRSCATPRHNRHSLASCASAPASASNAV